ncbi:MAG: hypothetical protein QOE92_554 [Chloroflexota bacterium]|jgi:uncharacterized membrane protein YhhN|nr:hypothetical protein [Chloroflexota bacterium]
MTGALPLLGVLTALVAAVDWVAVVTERKRLEYVCKPAVMVGLVAIALVLPAESEAQRHWFVAALALGLVGDVFLMLRRDMFLAGLGAFLLGHLCYIAGFLSLGVPLQLAALLAFFALLPGMIVLPRVVAGIQARGRGRIVPAVVAYSATITAMLGLAMASGRPEAQVGGLLFYASDTLISLNRFVSPRRWMRLAIIVTYHAGQALLVLSLVRRVTPL